MHRVSVLFQYSKKKYQTKMSNCIIRAECIKYNKLDPLIHEKISQSWHVVDSQMAFLLHVSYYMAIRILIDNEFALASKIITRKTNQNLRINWSIVKSSVTSALILYLQFIYTNA